MADEMINLCGSDVISGNDVFLEVQNQTTGEWVMLANQRSGTLNRDAESIDISSKENFGWSDSIAGARSWSFETDGMMIENHAGYILLDKAYNLGYCLRVRLRFPSGLIYMGLTTISSFPIETPYGEAVTYSVTLNGKGVLETDHIAPTIKPQGVTVTGYTVPIKVGAKVQLTASVTPVGASQAVGWVSYTPAVATVNETGEVTGVAIGSAPIRARAIGSPNAVGGVEVVVEAP